MSFVRTISLLLLILLICSCSKKLHFGYYTNKWRYWGDRFFLNKDSTFNYKCLSHNADGVEFSDTSNGTFSIFKDTIYLFYTSRLYYPYLSDNPKDSLKWRIVEPYGYFGNRPQKFLREGKKLYYIFEKTGLVWRNKEHHLQFMR